MFRHIVQAYFAPDDGAFPFSSLLFGGYLQDRCPLEFQPGNRKKKTDYVRGTRSSNVSTYVSMIFKPYPYTLHDVFKYAAQYAYIFESFLHVSCLRIPGIPLEGERISLAHFGANQSG